MWLKIFIGLFGFFFFLVEHASFADTHFHRGRRSSFSSASQFYLQDADSLENIKEIVKGPTKGRFLPVDGILTGHFGKWRGSRRRGHTHVGVDIAAPRGTPVIAPLKGEVIFTGRKGGYGLTVILDHGEGIYTLYGHNSKLLVREGDSIQKGQVISKVGSSGRSTGPHLHYEVRVEGEPVNPLAWTRKLQTAKL